jgi:hypothetical protein
LQVIRVFDRQAVMDERSARELARDLIRPCGLLGYLVGRGAWWADEGHLRRGKVAIGEVMASTFDLLEPVWAVYPALDPSLESDPLDLAKQELTLKDQPEDLRSLLLELEAALQKATPALVEEFPESEAHFTKVSAKATKSIIAARELLNSH